jgi:hypothetical protein
MGQIPSKKHYDLDPARSLLFSVNNEFEVVLQVWISSCWWDVYEGFEDPNQYGVSTTASRCRHPQSQSTVQHEAYWAWTIGRTIKEEEKRQYNRATMPTAIGSLGV